MAETRTFYTSGVEPRDVANVVSSWLVLHDFESRTIDLPDGGIAVQARQPKSWRYILGMSSALNITINKVGSELVVETGAGSWAEKIAVGAVGAFILHPLLITAAYGAWKQSQLPDKIFGAIEEYIKSRQGTAGATRATRATRIPVQSSDAPLTESAIQETAIQEKDMPEIVPPTTPEEIICSSCGEAADEGAKYCDQCGARLKPVSVSIE